MFKFAMSEGFNDGYADVDPSAILWRCSVISSVVRNKYKKCGSICLDDRTQNPVETIRFLGGFFNIP